MLHQRSMIRAYTCFKDVDVLLLGCQSAVSTHVDCALAVDVRSVRFKRLSQHLVGAPGYCLDCTTTFAQDANPPNL